MTEKKIREIPPGKILLRRLDEERGDVEEILDPEQVIVRVKDAEIIIDEDTNELIDKGKLEGELKAGKIKRVRVMPMMRGG
jgi:hypothetical protein